MTLTTSAFSISPNNNITFISIRRFFGSFSKFVSLEMLKKQVSLETLQKFRKMSQDLLRLEDEELKSTGGSNVEAMIEEKARTGLTKSEP
jgi:hypothetical protein